MADFTDLEQRLAYALERIATATEGPARDAAGGAAGAGDPSASSIEVDVLKAELEAERSANAQLTERVRAIKEKQETLLTALERKVQTLSAQLEQQGGELQRQRLMNVSLTRTNQKLSDSLREGVADPGVLNEALRTEVEAMRLSRMAEMAEMEEILAELRPLVGEVA
jgi:hypothetical protein